MRADPHPLVRGLPEHLSSAGRCLVMGVLNVTPDSFSDGGAFATADDAIRHGLTLQASGADLVDVGGESTRPGAPRVSEEEELQRVLPVVRRLSAEGVVVSIDTMRADVAARALEAGASVVNDVSGGLGDARMLAFMAGADVPCVLMHWRGHSTEMQMRAQYDDVVADVRAELAARVDAAVGAGVSADRLVLDPGIGFAKTAAHNWQVLAHLEDLMTLGRPILVGASRKGFLGQLLSTAEVPRPARERDDATTAITALAALAGAFCVRVHDVRASADAVRVVAAIAATGSPSASAREHAILGTGGTGRETEEGAAPAPTTVGGRHA